MNKVEIAFEQSEMSLEHKYSIDFSLSFPTEKGGLCQLLQAMLEIKSKMGIETKEIIVRQDKLRELHFFYFSYQDAESVVEGNMSEETYLERNSNKKGGHDERR